MLLHKTEKARLELSPGVRTLSLRERSLLLLADGKTLADLQAMYHGLGAQLIDKLMHQGYLTRPQDPWATADIPSDAGPAPATPPEATEHANARSGGDGLRSLAGTRMYLFDITERIFARRDPALAHTFREALRAARDRASMLDVSEALLEEVELTAGAERARTIRLRMDQLLPVETTVPAALLSP